MVGTGTLAETPGWGGRGGTNDTGGNPHPTEQRTPRRAVGGGPRPRDVVLPGPLALGGPAPATRGPPTATVTSACPPGYPLAAGGPDLPH